ncbi:uncharacterized protein [Musca autumnalis]|uniref:uncharacterized protein n=1 Tax=Musca autumnalis TaxID=221902 RepID=UPI003CE69718
MACPKWPMVIAYICVFGYTLSALYTFTGLVGWHNMGEEAPMVKDGKDADVKDEDPDFLPIDNEKLLPLSHEDIRFYVSDLVSDIIMTMISVFLVMGLKKQNYKFVYPWLIVSVIDVVLDLFAMYWEEESKSEIVAFLIFIMFIAAMWYPVYKQYKVMRHPKVVVPETTKMAVYPTGEFVHCTSTMATAPVQEV